MTPLEVKQVRELGRQALAAERERCAKIAENAYTNDIGQTGPRPTIQQAIAAAIRNLKD